MAMTPKQDRNGVPGPADYGTPIMIGAEATGEVRSVMDHAQNSGNSHANDGREWFTGPAGTGPHSMSGSGDMYDWDSGLAVSEEPGEA